MPSEPLVLGFDTSAAQCAAALLSGSEILAAAEETMGRGQAERLMPLLEEILAKAGAGWSDLDAVGVGIGPGNFTGIRISVAAARGIALGLGLPAIGVSQFDALTQGASDSRAVPVVAAPRGEIYLGPLDGRPARRLALGEAIEEIGARPVICAPDLADLVGTGRFLAPTHPIGEAICRVAAGRLGQPVAAPVPLYLRTADAAPARESAPVILP